MKEEAAMELGQAPSEVGISGGHVHERRGLGKLGGCRQIHQCANVSRHSVHPTLCIVHFRTCRVTGLQQPGGLQVCTKIISKNSRRSRISSKE